MAVTVEEKKKSAAEKKTTKKTIRMWVTRQQMPIYMNKGFRPVAGNGPNGLESQGDAVLMEISAEEAEKRRKHAREPYENIREKIRRGESPLGNLNSPYADFIYKRKQGKMG